MIEQETHGFFSSKLKRFIIVSFLMISCSIPSTAQKIDWEESPQFEIEFNGKIDVTTRAFQPSGSKPYIIVISEKISVPLLIDLGAKTIFELTSADIKSSGEYAITTNGIPKGKSIGSYSLKAGASTFSYDGNNVSMKIKESLVGDVSEAMILAHSPGYAIMRDWYKPKKASIDFLKKYKQKTNVVVMFATWCPTCKGILPKFFRIMRDAGNKNFSTRYIGIAMGGSEPYHELEKYGHDYPALIFFQNGKEKGKIIGEPAGALEDAIVSLLKKAS